MAYEINININGGSSIEETKETTAGVSKPNEIEKGRKALGTYVASQTIQPFLQNVKTQISQNIQTVTGNSELQQRINFGFEAVQYGVNAVNNIASGVVIAKSAGLSGKAGGWIGALLTVATSAIEIGFNEHRISLDKKIENYQLEQMLNRRGTAYNKSRS